MTVPVTVSLVAGAVALVVEGARAVVDSTTVVTAVVESGTDVTVDAIGAGETLVDAVVVATGAVTIEPSELLTLSGCDEQPQSASPMTPSNASRGLFRTSSA